MLRKLIHTTDDPTLTLLRVALGIVFLAHGAQKVLGWFGGNGWSASMAFFTHSMGIPAFFAALAILAEFLGGIGLIAGLLARVAALGIAIEMAVGVALVHGPNGFFMNWSGNKTGEGFEYHILAIARAIVIVTRGAGAFSLDRVLQRTGRRSIPVHVHHPHPMRG